ncbi:hypothetical protein [Longitalea luteola]|uniref:hypothetical protein n=1 Tax=Longitalea luteola TaxID=2812563 RepID=UPI001A95F8D6|nr:hypothetical protein [Longitalea luteola]
MKEEIRAHLNEPRQLERMYRANKSLFKRSFSSLYPELSGNPLADFWNERLNYEGDDINRATRKELLFVLFAVLFAGTIAKLPALLPIDEEFFYSRNAGFIIFPILSAYFGWKNKLSIPKIVFIVGISLASLVFINFLPDNKNSDTLILSCIHLLLVLWSVTGFAFVGERENDVEKRLNFLSYNGDLVVMTTLIVLAGGILSGITIGLFSLIGLHIEKWYMQNVVIFGLPAAPVLGTFLTQTNPQLVGKVSPVIARIFSPLVLVMLVIYLVAIIYSGKDPYNDREFLLVFNALLIGVMAIIFFSVAETTKATKSQAETWVLTLLSVVTLIVNGIALSAILFRISAWGITPNRAAVLGGNVLILINLLLVTWQLIRVLAKKTELSGVGKVISFYLPVYCIWAGFVTFLFPFLFAHQ